LSKSFQHFQRTRNIIKKSKGALSSISATLTWKKLPIHTKLRFFNMWFIITIIGNICNISGSLYDLIVDEEGEVTHAERFLIALGTLLAWVNMVRYLEFDKKYTVLLSTLQRGIPNVMRFTVGVFPIFMGFALFGLLYFAETSGRFSSFGEVCVTLIGLQLGDDIQGTFRQSETELIISRIYLFAFLFISIYAIANIFIAIMEEAFSFSAQEERDHKSKPKEIDIREDKELWDAILHLDKEKSPVTSGPPVDDPSIKVDQTNSTEPNQPINQPTSQPANVDVDELWEEISKLIDDQHQKFKTETEQQIRQIFKAKMIPRNDDNNQ